MSHSLVYFSVVTSEAYLGDITAKLTSLGASLNDLQNHDGVIRLTFMASETKMLGFEKWLSRATDGISKIHRCV
jgi:predicted membrane GTPase involved in stress response